MALAKRLFLKSQAIDYCARDTVRSKKCSQPVSYVCSYRLALSRVANPCVLILPITASSIRERGPGSADTLQFTRERSLGSADA
eukprot:2982258-Pyramimonas_sp.AAC.1